MPTYSNTKAPSRIVFAYQDESGEHRVARIDRVVEFTFDCYGEGQRSVASFVTRDPEAVWELPRGAEGTLVFPAGEQRAGMNCVVCARNMEVASVRTVFRSRPTDGPIEELEDAAAFVLVETGFPAEEI